jgi:hypothetical protein
MSKLVTGEQQAGVSNFEITEVTVLGDITIPHSVPLSASLLLPAL